MCYCVCMFASLHWSDFMFLPFQKKQEKDGLMRTVSTNKLKASCWHSDIIKWLTVLAWVWMSKLQSLGGRVLCAFKLSLVIYIICPSQYIACLKMCSSKKSHLLFLCKSLDSVLPFIQFKHVLMLNSTLEPREWPYQAHLTSSSRCYRSKSIAAINGHNLCQMP